MSPAGAEVAPRHQGVLVQEMAELGFAEPELVKEGSNVQPHDRPDDDGLMRSADTVADREHAKLNLAAIASLRWERCGGRASSPGPARLRKRLGKAPQPG